jgi:hypothetical protein
MESLIKKILLQNKNEKYLAKNIIEFVGENCCQKCYKNSKEPLTIVISFDKSKGSYYFIDLPGANYKLKKFCKKCTYSRASQAKIYIEVD